MGGHIYVIRFSDGTVKPGLTSSPANRMKTHRNTAACFGFHITDLWVSPSHCDVEENEASLIRWARMRASAVNKAEYFVGIDYRETVDFAQDLMRIQGVDTRQFRRELAGLEDKYVGMARARGVDRLAWRQPIPSFPAGEFR